MTTWVLLSTVNITCKIDKIKSKMEAIKEAQIIIKSTFTNRIALFGVEKTVVVSRYTISKSFRLQIAVGGYFCFALVFLDNGTD